MASTKKFNNLKDKERLLRLQEKKIERKMNPNEIEVLNLSLRLTSKEVAIIQRKTQLLKVKYGKGLTRSKILRKVLLNLDDEELICFLNLLTRNELKK